MTRLRNAAPELEEGQESEGHDPADGRWSSSEMLLAAVIDELRISRWLFVQANSAKGGSAKPPPPIRRPGSEKAAGRRRMSLKDAMRIDPRLRLTAAKSRRMSASDLAPYAEALTDDQGRLSVTRAMREMHCGRDKAAEAIRLAGEKRRRPQQRR
jgi:hypothetical protein